MCRLRFGLTDIHFEDCQPILPRRYYYRKLVAALPPVVEKNPAALVPEIFLVGPRKNVAKVTPQAHIASTSAQPPKRQNAKRSKPGAESRKGYLSSTPSSSSLSSDECHICHPTLKSKHSSIGVKRQRGLPLSSSSSDDQLTSKISSQPSTARLTKKSRQHKAPERSGHGNKPVIAPTQRFSKKPDKAPPKKKVRFAMDVEEKVNTAGAPNESRSSHSSDDSYTDPPPPIEPYDAFSGYYRDQGGSTSCNTRAKNAVAVARWHAQDDHDSMFLLDSEDGSDVDIQGLPVRKAALKTAKVNGRRHPSSQRQNTNIKTTLVPAKRLKKSPRSSRSYLESQVESEVGYGGPPAESRLHGKHSALSRHASGDYPHSKLGSSRKPREPTFVVMSKPRTERKVENKPTSIVRKTSKETRIRANGYQPPSISDDEDEPQWHSELGILFRDV